MKLESPLVTGLALFLAGSFGFLVGRDRGSVVRRKEADHARYDSVPAPVGPGAPLDCGEGGSRCRAPTGGRVGGPSSQASVAVPRMRHRMLLARPRAREDLAALGQLPVPNVPAREAATGEVPGAWGATGGVAVGRAEGPVFCHLRW